MAVVCDVLHANQAPLPVIWRHSRSSAFPRALDAVTECSQSTHPTHRWMRKPGSPFEEHFGQQAPAAQLTGAQAPAGELIGHRSPARSRQSSFRATSFREVLLAPHSKRSSASDLVCEANTKHNVWIRRCAAGSAPAVSPIVHARSAQVGI